ncbi:DUF262 domain-containing protein [Halomonas sp. NCCP-2165]|nr:DUF262 domain-containing protein [Halomonas sp. NCCP-2165]GKW48604.1 hypothetical protein NCCP2165_08190 [Halomonas sp. NCCP-2165]
MNMDPQNLKLNDLLHGRLFRIPPYQRPYSWQTEHRRDLFDDLHTLYQKRQEFHFMATVVGVDNGPYLLGSDEYQQIDIVDGQQRLTTLVLLLRAISQQLSEPALEKLLVKDDDHTLVLLQTNHDYNDHFINYVRHGKRPEVETADTLAERNIIEAIAEVETFVASWPAKTGGTLLELLALIKNRLRFVYYQLHDEKLVYTVFEVLNTRGLEVAWLDRCKAVLMGIAFEHAANQQEMVRELHDIWQRIYECIGLRQGLSSESLRFAATLITPDHTSRTLANSDALNTFRKLAANRPTQTLELSRFLQRVARALDSLLHDQQKAAVTKIAHARLLAVAITLRFEGTHRERLLTQWEHVTFRIYGMCGRDSRTRVGDYVRLACQVYASGGDETAYQDAMQALIALGCGEFSAAKAVAELRRANCYEGWEEELRYFFYARERWLEAEHGYQPSTASWNKIWSDSAVRSIEHILPQQPEDDSAWQALYEQVTPEQQEIKHWLGNLVVLPPAVNSRLGRKPYAEKRKEYAQTGLAITRELADEYSSWTLEQIEEREKSLVEWAEHYWEDLTP